MGYRPPLVVEPVTLVGSTIRLEPVSRAHAAGLAPNARPEYFALWPSLQPHSVTVEGMEDFVRRTTEMPNVLSFAIVRKETGEPIGMSSYMDIRPPHLGLEIGMTWITTAHQGTRVNPEAKLLMLSHAFEVIGTERVQLKTDLRNVQSQAALAKLGAVREGVLRKHMQMPDGHMRDTVMYSITADEWPQIKAGLLARLH